MTQKFTKNRDRQIKSLNIAYCAVYTLQQ